MSHAGPHAGGKDDPRPRIEVCAAVIRRGERFLLARRPPGSHLEGAWEFPGGKPRTGEDHAACLQRELIEELGLRVHVGARIATVDHDYPDKSIRLHFYACRPEKTDGMSGREGQEFGWFLSEEVAGLSMAPADRVFVENYLRPAGLRRRGRQ